MLTLGRMRPGGGSLGMIIRFPLIVLIETMSTMQFLLMVILWSTQLGHQNSDYYVVLQFLRPLMVKTHLLGDHMGLQLVLMVVAKRKPGNQSATLKSRVS